MRRGLPWYELLNTDFWGLGIWSSATDRTSLNSELYISHDFRVVWKICLFSRHLGQRVQLECDGQRIPLPELQGIVVLNIPSFMGGTNFWGGTRGDDIFLAPSFDDRILEVSENTNLLIITSQILYTRLSGPQLVTIRVINILMKSTVVQRPPLFFSFVLLYHDDQTLSRLL